MFQGSYQSSGSFAGASGLRCRDDARHIALRLFRKARLAGRAWVAWMILTARPHRLLALTPAQRAAAVQATLTRGVRTVPLAAIDGSEGRSEEFDAGFHPTQSHSRDRWVSVAAARLQGKPLPRVTLVQVGEHFFVRDGHHRISVARALGEAFIDAEVL